MKKYQHHILLGLSLFLINFILYMRKYFSLFFSWILSHTYASVFRIFWIFYPKFPLFINFIPYICKYLFEFYMFYPQLVHFIVFNKCIRKKLWKINWFQKKNVKKWDKFFENRKKNQKKSCPQILPPFYHDGGKCAQMCRRSVSPRLHGKNG